MSATKPQSFAHQQPMPQAGMTPDDFRRIAAIVRRESGIYLASGKERLVYGRLAKRIRQLALPSFASYCDFLEGGTAPDEIRLLINAITTNVTGFFRERHHFDFLSEHAMAALSAKARQGGRVRLWSAGCSNGAEPYSIAAAMLARDPDLHKYDVLILGTDIDTAILDKAIRGAYTDDEASGMPRELAARYFTRDDEPGRNAVCVTDTMKSLVRFKQLNLHEAWHFKGGFDAIFCRNVMIYFDEQDQRRIWMRMAERLQPNGWLFIGHSERISGEASEVLKHRGPTIYQKAAHS